MITCTLNLEIYSCVSNDEVLIKPDAVISISVSTLPNDILDSEGISVLY